LSRDEKWLLSGGLLFASLTLLLWWGLKYSIFQSTLLSSRVEELLNQTLLHMGIGQENIAEKFSEEKEGKIIIHETIIIPNGEKFVEELSRRLKKARFSFSLRKEGDTFLLSVGKHGFTTHILKLKSKVEESSLSHKPRVAIIIDDIGYGGKGDELALTLPPQITLSFLPQTPYAGILSEKACEKGFEIILHQPLEGRKVDPYPNPGKITCSMKREEMERILNKNLSTVKGVVGVSNHEGSIFTSQKEPLEKFLPLIKERELFFLDSLTTSKSQVEEIASRYGLPLLKRDIFLDNRKDPAYIHKQFQKLLTIAYRRGYAIGIGHSHPVTIETLRKELEENRDKILLVHLSSLFEESIP